MALTTQELTQITRAIQLAKQLLERVQPLIAEANVAFNAAGGILSTIQQGDLDGSTALAGMTTAQLSNGVFALTSTVATALATAQTALTAIAVYG